MGLLVWSPLAGGFLSGKFTRGGPEDDSARRSKFTFPPVDLEKGYDMVEAIQAIAQRRNGTVAQVALAWLLHQPAVTSVIVGARNARQLKDNLGSVELKLDEPELARLDKVSQLAPEYLGWMLAGQGSDRRPGQVRDWSKFMKVKR